MCEAKWCRNCHYTHTFFNTEKKLPIRQLNLKWIPISINESEESERKQRKRHWLRFIDSVKINEKIFSLAIFMLYSESHFDWHSKMSKLASSIYLLSLDLNSSALLLSYFECKLMFILLFSKKKRVKFCFRMGGDEQRARERELLTPYHAQFCWRVGN